MLRLKLFDIPCIGKYVCRAIVKCEGGDKESKSLRAYYSKKYKVHIEDYSYGGCFDETFNLGGEIFIGKYCSFAWNIKYFGANHPMHLASMSPYFYNKEFGGFNVKDVERSTLRIGNDCWIGSGVIITSGCHSIGNGAVVGAGSVVTHDVEPYAVVAGNPAKLIRQRFDDIIISELEASRWYELSPKDLMKYYDYIQSPLDFARKIREFRNMEDREELNE